MGLSVSPDRWQRLWEVFGEAVNRDPGERPAFLDQACGDEGLRLEVEQLLAAHASDGILDKRAVSVAPLSRQLTPGERLASRFRIVRQIGAGGMGTVYEAIDEDLGATVAVKTLNAEVDSDAVAHERFRREVVLARRVTHPNACRLFDLFYHRDESGSVAFVTMELLRGETLSARVRRSGPLGEADALVIVEQVAGALNAAHRAGIVHRDLKSANVVLVPPSPDDPNGRAVVTDFGLAALNLTARPANDAALTRTGQLLGTPAYMAPEQLEGGEVTPATDIYGLGLLMYEMATGEAPLANESPLTIAIKRTRETAPSPRLRRPDLSGHWNTVILRCLERDPADRYSTADDVVTGLRSPTSRRLVVTRRGRQRLMWAAAVVMATVAIAAVIARPSERVTGSKLPFNARGLLLVADFDNRTGDAALDDTIRFALERDLQASQFVNVVPRERVADVLALMKRSADTRIDADLAREVALRDGSIRAVVRGRIEKLDGTYVTSAELLDPTTRIVVATFATEARGQQAILTSVRDLSNRLRSAVGEGLPPVRETNDALARATTPSLRALQLFSQADSLIRQGASAAAEQVLRQAIVEDPTFASAFMHLAHAIRNQRRPADEFLPHAERAMALADTVDDSERLFMQASYYGMRGDDSRALASYQALLQLHPDHYWGINNAALTLERMGRGEDAVPYFERLMELRPNNLAKNHDIAYSIAVRQKNVVAARRVIDRLRRIVTPEVRQHQPIRTAWIDVFTVHERRLRGDLDGALAELQQLEQTLPAISVPHDPSGFGMSAFAYEVMLAYQSLGRFRDAERVFAVPSLSAVALINSFLRGERALRARWSRVSPRQLPLKNNAVYALIFARLGLAGAAVHAASENSSPIPQAALARLQGNTQKAIPLYEQGLAQERIHGSSTYFLGCEDLAQLWLRQGETHRAVVLLEDAVQQKDRTIRGSSGAFWHRVAWQLSKIYRQIGRQDDAGRLERELLQALAVADSDHPILVELLRTNTKSTR